MSFGKREGAGRRRRFVRYVCAVALACASACVQAQAPWPANLYNPQATAGDIVLPMGGESGQAENAPQLTPAEKQLQEDEKRFYSTLM